MQLRKLALPLMLLGAASASSQAEELTGTVHLKKLTTAVLSSLDIVSPLYPSLITTTSAMWWVIPSNILTLLSGR
mgnify:CR=1 FL=1